MKINTQNSPTFNAGLTKQIKQEIACADIRKISAEFLRNNIETDFKDNKTIAWCALKSLQILKSLKLGLPKGVFVENFETLHADNQCYGFCNVLPLKLHRNKEDVVSEKTIFFNNLFNWENIDRMSDENFQSKNSPTDFFLDTILHEFAHSAHATKLMEKFSGNKLEYLIQALAHQPNLNKFRLKYHEILKSICDYALTNPFEAVACDFTKRVISNMDTTTLTLSKEFKKNNPYVWRSIFSSESGDVLENTIRHFWRGRFSE